MEETSSLDLNINRNRSVFASSKFTALFSILVVIFAFLIIYNLFSGIPDRARISSLNIEVPLIPVDASELRKYEERIKEFEEKKLLENYNEKGIFTKDQLQEGMIRPSPTPRSR